MAIRTILLALAVGIAACAQAAKKDIKAEIPKDQAPTVGSTEPEVKTVPVPHRTFELKDTKVVTPIPGKPERWVKVPTSTTRIDARKPYMRVYYWPPNPPTSEPSAAPEMGREAGEAPKTSDGRPFAHGMNTDPVNFAFNSAEVLPPATHLAQVAGWVRSNPNNAVTLTGHADPRGSKAFNQRLSEKRAEAVRARLVELGVPAERISVQAFGAAQQKRAKRSEDAWWLSRRVEITLRAASEPNPKS